MLIFFAISTVINLALGYGLAIYLMRTRQEQLGIDLAEPLPGNIKETLSFTPPQTSDATGVPPSTSTASSHQPKMPASELPELVSPMLSTQSQNQQSQPKNPDPLVQSTDKPEQRSDTVENDGPIHTAPTETDESPPDDIKTSDLTTIDHSTKEKQTLVPIPELKQDIEQDPSKQMQPSTEHDPTSDLASTTPASTDSDSQPPSEEDLLAGIAAFRAQLSTENPTASPDTSNSVETGATPG